MLALGDKILGNSSLRNNSLTDDPKKEKFIMIEFRIIT